MKNGPARFNFYLDQIEKLLEGASVAVNPALWLYTNGARTPLFMLEGLAKLYGGLHNKNRFEKLELQFKLLEDGLGAIDYYDAFAKEFTKDKATPVEIAKFLESKAAENAARLNELLLKKKWIGENANRLGRIRRKLSGASWVDEKAEMKLIENFYRASIAKIGAFAKTYKNGFTNLEEQVHELRRKLRWLSIYPQALQGCIQLTEKSAEDGGLAKYLTPEIVNSPFNKMPAAGTNTTLLMFEKDYFLALSWMIAELGKLKDQGLRIIALNEAGHSSIADGADGADTTAILTKATGIVRTYFSEKNLDKILAGMTKKS